MLEFYKFKQGDGDMLFSEKRLAALSGYALYKGQALKITAGALCGLDTAACVSVYAISNVSAASSVVTAAYIPEVFPVNSNQVWKAPTSTALTAAAIYAGAKVNFGSATTPIGTAIAGDAGAASVAWVYNAATASDPTTSAIYICFPDVI